MKIFYFTGTGNSLAAARDISLNFDSEIIPIIKSKKQERLDYSNEKVIGIVAPVYCGGIPDAVKKFLEEVKLNKNAYIFFIVNCAGGEGYSVPTVRDILKSKGLKLSYFYKLVMPSNYFFGTNRNTSTKVVKRLGNVKPLIAEIVEDIKNRKTIESDKKNNEKFFNRAMKFEREILRTKDKRVVKKQCIECDTCIYVCPVDNIEKKDGTYTFGDKCEECFACYQWCPKSAIKFGFFKNKNKKAYHHPNVTVKDMIDQKKI